MAANLFSPAALLKGMAEALPTHQKDDSTSDISAPLDAVALFVHACMVAAGFRLVGFDEGNVIEAECQKLAPRLPPQWNQSISSHSFVYAHSQSSMRFLVRVDKLGSKTEIRGLAIGDERIHRFEITRSDHVSSSALPLRIPVSQDDGVEDRSGIETKLRDVFVSEARMSDLAQLVKINIIQRLIPSLQKEGYEDPDDRAARQDADEAGRSGARPPPQMPDPMPRPAQPNPYLAPEPMMPQRPIPAGDFPPPGFDDEYDINRPHRMPLPGGLRIGGGRDGAPGRSPFNIGHDDLNPPGLGPNDPLRGSFVGGGGLPAPGRGGMHPTFEDDLFQGVGGRGGDGFDSQAPPGARWDPIGPGGQPRFGGGRPGGGGAFGGGGPYGGFGGDII